MVPSVEDPFPEISPVTVNPFKFIDTRFAVTSKQTPLLDMLFCNMYVSLNALSCWQLVMLITADALLGKRNIEKHK
jgi:hypothetical protein